MPSSRTLSWSVAIRDIRADRIYFGPGERQAISRHRGFAEVAFRRAQRSAYGRSLHVSGAYDRRVIMCLAAAAAKARRAVTGEEWRVCISAALEGTWRAAKAARLTAGWHGSGPVVSTHKTSVRTGPQATLTASCLDGASRAANTSAMQPPVMRLKCSSWSRPVSAERIPNSRF